MDTLEQLERGALVGFADTGDATHLLVLADACREDGRPPKLWLEEVCRGVASDATLHQSAAWFCANWPLRQRSLYKAPAAGESDAALNLRGATHHAFTERWMAEQAANFQLVWEPVGPQSHSQDWELYVDGWGKAVEFNVMLTHQHVMPKAPIRDNWYNEHYYPIGNPAAGPKGSADSFPGLSWREYEGEYYPPQQRFAEVCIIEKLHQRNTPLPPVTFPDLETPLWLLAPVERPLIKPAPVCVFRRHQGSGTTVALFPTELPLSTIESLGSALVCRAVSLRWSGTAHDFVLADDYRYYEDFVRSSRPAFDTWIGYQKLHAAMTAAGIRFRAVSRAPAGHSHIRRKKLTAMGQNRPA